jgi:GTP-binding protein Era
MEKRVHKAGFVTLIGNPNAGKSTLMNTLLGQKLSIITPKAQTTRHRIKGILSEDYYQIVFSDTPGIVDPAYKMHEGMMEVVGESVDDADLILLLSDITRPEIKDIALLDRIKKSKTPVIVLINKIDLSDQKVLEENMLQWSEMLPEADIIPVSALKNFNLDLLLNAILKKLPESPPYFDKEQLSDLHERFFVAEIIREKIFLQYQEEIPYSCEVAIEAFEETESIARIRAEIHVLRDSQKPILIGKGGESIKRLGITARKDIEKFLGKHIHLDLYVRVSENWRDKPLYLRQFGYLR